MGPTASFACAHCGSETTHRLVARTTLQIGPKRKWECTRCEHRILTIDGDIVAPVYRAE